LGSVERRQLEVISTMDASHKAGSRTRAPKISNGQGGGGVTDFHSDVGAKKRGGVWPLI